MPLTNDASSICPSAHHSALFFTHCGISVIDALGGAENDVSPPFTTSISNGIMRIS